MTRRYIRYVLWFVGIGFVVLIVAKMMGVLP